MSGSEARSTSRPSPKAMASMLSALQTELAAERAATVAKVAALEDTIANLAHENALLKRRLFGNKTERAQTSELQLALGDCSRKRRGSRPWRPIGAFRRPLSRGCRTKRCSNG